MGDVTTIGLDIAKTSFQARGADESGAVVFRKALSRGRLLAFFAAQRGAWWRWKPVLARIIGAGSWSDWAIRSG